MVKSAIALLSQQSLCCFDHPFYSMHLQNVWNRVVVEGHLLGLSSFHFFFKAEWNQVVLVSFLALTM